MAASKIIPKKSVVSKVPEPTALVPGEIAINYADKIIYGRHPSKSATDPEAVVALSAPYLHSHDQLISLNPTTGAAGTYDLELTNDGDITVSDGAVTTTINPTSTASRTISLPDKSGTIALLTDVAGGVGGSADELLSQDATKKITLSNAGTLEYVSGVEAAKVYTLPGSTGTIGLRGGDTVISDTKPEAGYLGLRWIDSTNGRAFDWFVDQSGGEHWVEMGVGADGRQVDFRVSGGYIQWQYAGDAVWVNLVALTDLKGDAGLDGLAVELRINSTHIQWRLGGGAWLDLVALVDIKGPAGSNATVTTASINSALGYTPDNPTSPRTPSAHNHDERYYTETEVNTLLAGKQASGSYAATNHNHDASHITTGTLSVDRIPVLPSQAPVVSGAGLPALTSSQIAEITTGTVVITTDGKRYVYKGSGDKTSAGSYIELADLTPTWTAVIDKPTWLATFNPGTSQFAYTQITGLANVANTGDYNHLINQPTIPAAQVNADWEATEGVQVIYNKPVLFSGSYNDLTDLPDLAGAKIRRSAWDAANKYSYLGSAAAGTAESVSGWTITRIATTASGSVASVLTENGAWNNRTNLFP